MAEDSTFVVNIRDVDHFYKVTKLLTSNFGHDKWKGSRRIVKKLQKGGPAIFTVTVIGEVDVNKCKNAQLMATLL